MALDHVMLVIFGSVLVGLLIFSIFYYYSDKRKDRVEVAKYKMLEDEDEK
ncbi:MAG: CcoQ/FixQ family Cbb3-type cytochrome c oxidase assembly chaperone [Deferribacterales bacterium]